MNDSPDDQGLKESALLLVAPHEDGRGEVEWQAAGGRQAGYVLRVSVHIN